jgi:hypothetical protein
METIMRVKSQNYMEIILIAQLIIQKFKVQHIGKDQKALMFLHIQLKH